MAMARVKRRVSVGSVLAILLLSIAPSLVLGASWGSSGCGPNQLTSICITGNYDMTVYYSGFTSAMISSSDTSLSTITNLTDAYGHRTTTLSGADGIAYYVNLGDTGYHAWEYCPSTSTRTGSDPYVVCTPQAADFDSYYATWYADAFNRAFITCHEYGHFLGLHHNTDYPYSCMNPAKLSASFNAGDISLVNLHY